MKQANLTVNSTNSLLTLVILCKKDFELNNDLLTENVKNYLLTSLEHLEVRAPLEMIEELLPSLHCIAQPWSINGNFKQWQILQLYNENKLIRIHNFKIKFKNNFQALDLDDLYLDPVFKALIIDYRPDAPKNILTEINKIKDDQLKTAILEQVVEQLSNINNNCRGQLTLIFLEIIFSNACYLQSKTLETLLFKKLIPNWLQQNSKQIIVPSCISPNFLNSIYQYLKNYKKNNFANYGNLLLTNHFLFNQLICISTTLDYPEIKENAISLNCDIARLSAVSQFFAGQTNDFNPETHLVFLSRPIKRTCIEKIKNRLKFENASQPKILREAITFDFAKLQQFLFTNEDVKLSHEQPTAFSSINENLLFADCKINIFKQPLLPGMKVPVTTQASVTSPEISLLNFPLLYKQYTRYHKNSVCIKLLKILGLAREFINHLVDALLDSPDLNNEYKPFSGYLPINFAGCLDQELAKKFTEFTNMPKNFNGEDYNFLNNELELSGDFKTEIYKTFDIESAQNEEKAKVLNFISNSLAKLAEVRFTGIENHYITHLRYLAIAARNSAREISPEI